MNVLVQRHNPSLGESGAKPEMGAEAASAYNPYRVRSKVIS